KTQGRIGIRCAFLRKLPGRALHNEFVDLRNKPKYGFNAASEFQILEVLRYEHSGSCRACSNLLIAGRLRYRPVKVLMDHRERAACQITDAVGEIGVVAFDQSIVAEIAVLSIGDFAPQEVTQRIRAGEFIAVTHHLRDRARSHYIAARFAHFAFLHKNPAMAEDLFRERQSSRHQECRPVDGMKTQNVFSNQVKIGRPEVLPLHGAHVGDQRIKPDIEYMPSFHRHGNAPVDGRARDGKIVQPLLYEADCLAFSRLGADKIRLPFVEFQQLILECGELEKIILLGDGFRDTPTIRAWIAGLGVIYIQLIVKAILTRIRTFIDIAILLAAFEQILYDGEMLWIGSAYEFVIRDSKRLPLPHKFVRDRGRVFFRAFADGPCGAFHILAMFVSSGRKNYGAVSLLDLETLDQVRGKRAVCRADVRRGVHIVDRSREIVLAFTH